MDIVVASCAAYSDCWAPFHTLFKRFWPDCPFPLVLVTDSGKDQWPGERVIETAGDHGWCRNLLKGLEQLGSEYVLLLQEDFWLNFPTNTAFIKKALDTMKADPSVACFRIYPCPGPDVISDLPWGLIAPGARYRVSCQAGMWRAADLKALLARFNTPREFEIDGTNFVNSQWANRKFLAVHEPDPNKWPIQYYCTAIVRGEFDENALDFCKAQNVPVDTSRRSTFRCPR